MNYKSSIWVHSKVRSRLSFIERQTDGLMERQTDGLMDKEADRVIPLRLRVYDKFH